jgi:predicted phage baseplate assembly protein
MRAQREVRAQQRAVTAEDFEVLAKRASRAVARAKCNTSRDVASGAESVGLPPGMVDLLVVPAAFDALRAGDLTKLAVEQPVKNEVRFYLDRYRLLTCTVNIREPRYLGIRVHTQIVPSEHHQVGVVVARVRELLKLFITPLTLETDDQVLADILEPGWEGWPFGRDLYVSEIYSLIQRVPGVRHVLDVRLGQRAMVPARELARQESASEDSAGAQAEEGSTEGEEEAALSEQRAIEVPPDTLLCLLDCEVEVVRL